MVLMIIKGLFRRYQRWNPVHPTYGAFWGMGVGIGCGVGWGPGFGPEVIGYVGAGCGVGFCVGITLAGFGIGLPANFLTNAPLKVLTNEIRLDGWLIDDNNVQSLDSLRPKQMASYFSGSAILEVRKSAGGEWNGNIPLQFRSLQEKANESFSHLKDLDIFKHGTEMFDVKNALASQRIFSLPERFKSLKKEFPKSCKGEQFLFCFLTTGHFA
ncbi:Cadmium-induced protein AS8 [Bienertia sinuspersici]